MSNQCWPYEGRIENFYFHQLLCKGYNFVLMNMILNLYR